MGDAATRVKGANEARRAEGARGGAARERGAGRKRETHQFVSSVSWSIASGMVPLIWLLLKYLRM